MSAKQVLELEIKQTTTGDGVTKVTVDLVKAKGGLTDFEKAMMGTRSTIGGLDKDIIAFDKNLGSMADAMSAFGVSIPQSPMALFGQLAREGVDLAWESIQMAGDASEQASLFQQTFRGESKDTRVELEAYGAEVGRSTISLMDMASGIQTILVPMGMARDMSADWSVTLAKLSTDLGAAFNKEDADVLADIRSGLLGSTEVLEKYGINLKMTAVNQELVNMGVEGGIQKATELEKTQARLNVIMQSTADYQGQAARESDGFNGQMKELEATVQDLKISMGEGLLPIVNTLLGALNNGNRTIDASRRYWAAMDEQLRLGIISQEEYNEQGREFSRMAREGNAITSESIEMIKGLEAANQQAIFTQAGYGDMVEEDIAALQDYGMELDGIREDYGEVSDETEDAIEKQMAFADALSEITSVDTNFKGIVSLATRYDSILEQIDEKHDQIKKFNEISATGGYIDGIYYSASDAKEEVHNLKMGIHDLQTEMSAMANQVVLDMLMATISVDEVSETEAQAYFQLAADMGTISQEAADAAVLAYGGAIDYINGLAMDPKTGEVVINVTYNDPGFTPSSGSIAISGRTIDNSIKREFEAEGDYVLPGQSLLVGELGPEPFIPTVPGQIVSNRDMQNGVLGGITINMNGPVYMRTIEEIRDVMEEILVEASRR